MPIEPNQFDDAHLIAARANQIDPIVQYYIVKRDVMSIGKLCAQINHGCMMFMLAYAKLENHPAANGDKRLDITNKWLNESFRKIVKVGTEKDFEKVKQELMVFSVKDAGLTEVDPGTETVLVTWPMLRSETPKSIVKLRLLESHHLK